MKLLKAAFAAFFMTKLNGESILKTKRKGIAVRNTLRDSTKIRLL